MGFRLVPKLVILNAVMAIILPNLVAFVANYVKLLISLQQIFPKKCHKVHQLSTSGVPCSSW